MDLYDRFEADKQQRYDALSNHMYGAGMQSPYNGFIFGR